MTIARLFGESSACRVNCIEHEKLEDREDRVDHDDADEWEPERVDS